MHTRAHTNTRTHTPQVRELEQQVSTGGGCSKEHLSIFQNMRIPTNIHKSIRTHTNTRTHTPQVRDLEQQVSTGGGCSKEHLSEYVYSYEHIYTYVHI